MASLNILPTLALSFTPRQSITKGKPNMDKKAIGQRRKELQAEIDKLNNLEKLESSKAVTEKSIATITEVFSTISVGKISKAHAKKLGQFLQEKGIEELLKKL